MQRANMVLDHTLAILRTTFRDVLMGGSMTYDHATSLPMLNPAPTGEVLYWEEMFIGADNPRDVLTNTDIRTIVGVENAEKQDSRNLVSIDVQIARETAAPGGASSGAGPSYEMEMGIIVNVSMKEERWEFRLIHGIFGVIENALQRNQNLCHPQTGEVGAKLVEYRSYEINTGDSGQLLLAVGESFQTWRVVPLTNKTIGLTPRPTTP